MVTVSRDLDKVDWVRAADVFRRAPLGNRDPKQLERAFRNSYAVSIAWDGDVLVGLGRAISDREFQAAIYDLVVDPERQGAGIGTALMEDLQAQLDVPNIVLYSVPGKEAFYRRFGYRLMRTGMAIFSADKAQSSAGYLDDDA